MARSAIVVTKKNAQPHQANSVKTIADQGTAIQALITTALAAAGGAHDSTPEITAIQTAVTAMTTAFNGNLVVDVDTAVVTDMPTATSLLRAVTDWLLQQGTR